MKLVYAVDRKSYNGKNHLGVVKKVEAQMRLFKKNGFKTQLYQYDWVKGHVNIVLEKDTDILYFRRIEPSLKMISTMHYLHKISPKVRMIMEIPTYPFKAEEKEKKSLKRRISLYCGEKLLRTCIDRIVLIAQPTIKKLYGIPVININNGVEFEKISRVESSNENRGIHLICVSGCYFWHGYDRLIEGLYNYYMQDDCHENVFLHIVGDGDCLEDYKNMAGQYGLKDKTVFFYGAQTGEKLDEIYDKCDIAVECLGCHRKNLALTSSLKSREYAAKGLPMIAGNELDFCNKKTEKYIKLFPADDSPVKINEVIAFYHDIYDGKDKNTVHDEIREIFYPYSDWKFVAQPLIKYMISNKKEIKVK